MDRVIVAAATAVFAFWAVALLLGKRKARQEAKAKAEAEAAKAEAKARAKEKAGAGARAGHSRAAEDEQPSRRIWEGDIRTDEPPQPPWYPQGFDDPELPGERRPELEPPPPPPPIAPEPAPPVLPAPGVLMSILGRRALRRATAPAAAERRSEVAARFKKKRVAPAKPAPLVKVDTPVPVPDQQPRKRLAAGEATTAAVKAVKEYAEDLVLPAFLAIPQAAQMKAIVTFIGEGMVRLVRLRNGRDVRTPIAKVYAYAHIAEDMTHGLRLLHDDMVDHRHDPRVIEAVAEFAAAARRLAEIGRDAADTTAKRYRGTASDQARGVRLPDMRD